MRAHNEARLGVVDRWREKIRELARAEFVERGC